MPADRMAHGAGRPALVEDDHLGLGIAEPLRGQEGDGGRLAGAGRPDCHGMADVAGMQVQIERRGAMGLADQQGRRVQMGVPALARPHRGQRQHVGQVQGRDDRPADIAVIVAGQGREPGVGGVEGLGPGDEAETVDLALDQGELFPGDVVILIPDHDHRGEHAEADHVLGELGERVIGITGLVQGIGVDHGAFLLADHFHQQAAEALSLGEPLALQAGQLGLGVALVETEKPRRPAIFERHRELSRSSSAGVVEDGKALDRQHLDPAIAEHRRQAGQEVGVVEKGIRAAAARPAGAHGSTARRRSRAGR